MKLNSDNFNFEPEVGFFGGEFQEKPTKCEKCKEMTFKTTEELFIICQGCMFKTERKRRKEIRQQGGAQENPDTMADIDSPYFYEHSEETQKKFESVLGRFHKLSDMEKQVIELLWEEKTQNEVAEILSISRDEVNTYLKRARNKLK